MEQNVLRHPRSFVRNVNTSNSRITPYNNVYSTSPRNSHPTENNAYNLNQNIDNAHHSVFNPSFSNCVYNTDRNVIDSDHNTFRTDQNISNCNSNQGIFNEVENVSGNGQQNMDENINTTNQNFINSSNQNFIYSSTNQNFMEKPNQDCYNGYYGNNDDQYSNVISDFSGNSYGSDIYNTSNQNNLVWNSSSDSNETPLQDYNQHTSWISPSNSIQNPSQNSILNQGMSTFHNKTSSSFRNSSLKHMEFYNETNVTNSNSNKLKKDNHNIFCKNEENNEDFNKPELYDAEEKDTTHSEVSKHNKNSTSYNDNRIQHMYNTEQYNMDNTEQYNMDNTEQYNMDNTKQYNMENTKQYNMENTEQYNMENTEQYDMENTEQYDMENTEQYDMDNAEQYDMDNAEQYDMDNTDENEECGSSLGYDDEHDNTCDSNIFVNNDKQQQSNTFVNNDKQQQRADIIVVLSLLQDMVTAIEITESTRAMHSSRSSSQMQDDTSEINSNSNMFADEDSEDELLDDESEDDDENENSFTNKEDNIQKPSSFRFSMIKDKNFENEQSIEQSFEQSFDQSFEEEISDESEEFECKSSTQNVTKNTVKKKSYNQRKNIRNVFADKQLDAKTQLLREKEKERLQRLGLKQSIENTGKMLRAHVKKTVVEKVSDPLPKKKEVICLDSDSEEDYQVKWSNKAKSGGKEPILVLSSDSEEGEDGSGPVFDELVQSEDYYSELGLHTNDSLNVYNSDGKVLVNVNHNKDDKDIFLHPAIGDNLKSHQIGGVRFLYDNLIESVAHFRPEEGNGCILAHAMGLGKTIQTITFIDLFLRYTSARKVLCVVPVNTIQNWMNEFNRWLPAKHDDFNICDYVPKVTVPKAHTPKSKKVKISKKQEEDAAMIKELLDDIVEYVVEKQMSTDVADVVNELLSSVCDDKRHVKKEKLVDPVNKVNCDGHRDFHVFLIDAHKNQVERAKIIEEWDKCGGVLLTGYEMYRSIAMYKVASHKVKGKATKRKKLTDENGDVLLRLKKAVCKPGPDLVVCDEGHRIRNYQSGISQALKSIRTRKRLVLTGYPLQNNLIEYWCMVDFVRPNYLGSRQEFSNMFERPIMNGQCVDSTPKDKHLMKQRAHVLYSLLQGFVQRRGHDVFNEILPQKEEHVLMIRLSPIQKALYNRLIELTRDAYNDSLNPVKTFSLCCKIWNHPDILYDAIQMSQEGKKVDIIGDEDDIALDDSNGRQRRKRKQPTCLSPVPNGSLLSNIGFDPFGTEAKDLLTDIVQWAAPIFKIFPYRPGNIENSGKFVVLKSLLDHTLCCDDKMLLFSQSLLTLNAIEMMLQKNFKHKDGSFWRKGRDYYRLDGGTNSLERERMINAFNDSNNMETKLFILSTRAGCLGINLVAANRVVVFDVSWNPCHDAQAVCRIYRYGQKKQCHIYRLVSSNTMEKKIYYRQLSKQGISDRVVDEANLTENFSKNEIQSLVIEDWIDEPFQDFSTSAFSFNDPVLTSTLFNSPQWITKLPFQHESLLINESSQKLSGSEKRAAKREYEQERMMVHGSAVPNRPCPLQQNFPRNTPVAPVRPFLWRPPLAASWLHNPSTLYHHTVSHNVTVPSSFPSTDPLQILRNGAYTGDHSYTGTDTSIDRTRSTDYWSSLDSQLNSIRNSFSSSNITSVLNRNRSLLHIGPHNNPLARLTQSVTRDTSTASSSSNGTPVISNVFATVNPETTVGSTTYPLTHTTVSSIVQNAFSYPGSDEKAREEGTVIEQAVDSQESPVYHTEQSLNFDDSSDFYDMNSLDNDSFTAGRDPQNNRNFEIIVLDDDEDD